MNVCTRLCAHAETRSGCHPFGGGVTGLLQDAIHLMGAEISGPHKNYTANALIFELSFKLLNLLFPVLQSA